MQHTTPTTSKAAAAKTWLAATAAVLLMGAAQVWLDGPTEAQAAADTAASVLDAQQQAHAEAEAALLRALHQHQQTHPEGWTHEQIARARVAAAIAARHQP